jgi:hypothetical protein
MIPLSFLKDIHLSVNSSGRKAEILEVVGVGFTKDLLRMIFKDVLTQFVHGQYGHRGKETHSFFTSMRIIILFRIISTCNHFLHASDFFRC